MKKVIIILSATIMLTGCNVKSSLYELAEYAYHQGQVDALNGDIKIDSTSYYWVKVVGTTAQHQDTSMVKANLVQKQKIETK